ncbi:DUF5011 domain-containing protein [Chitinophagaceae bacterium 26-R-25]|nr:DUF5011 domain-containing protein [Chitinophagaceae bacterium 26-R-25]
MTRNILSLFIITATCLTLGACRKYSPVESDTHVGISKITYYPIISTNGEYLIILDQGAAYTDAGATATVNGQPITPVVSGSVNTAVPAVYNLTYTATNDDGFSATDWRTVVVIGNDVASNDYSGSYARDVNGLLSTWTKTAKGVYNVDNPGGAGVGFGYVIKVVNYTGSKIAIPKQYATDPDGVVGIVSGASETYNATATPPKYSWSFLAGGYGTQVRNFVKQ